MALAVFWGLKVNPLKSTALNITIPPTELSKIQEALSFSWFPFSIPYLGIELTASLSDLYSANYLPMLTHLTNLMTKWSNLPLAWMGSITMVSALLQQRIFSYVWDAVRPRIPHSTLYIPKIGRGLGLPNFAKYYYAAQLAPLSKITCYLWYSPMGSHGISWMWSPFCC